MQGIEVYLKKLKSVLGILIAGIALFIYMLTLVVPIAADIFKLSGEYKKSEETLKDKKRTLEDMEAKTAEADVKSEQDKKTLAKVFYKPIEKGLDTEAVIADEFSEILTLLRENLIKTRSIKYEYDPQSDSFVRNVPSEYHVAKLDTEMIGTYKNFESFLKELYKHEHFLDISNIEIVPYQKDKKILLIKFQLKLYAQR